MALTSMFLIWAGPWSWTRTAAPRRTAPTGPRSCTATDHPTPQD